MKKKKVSKTTRDTILVVIHTICNFFAILMMIMNFVVCGLAMKYAYELKGEQSNLFLMCCVFFVFSNLLFVKIYVHVSEMKKHQFEKELLS